MVIIQIITLCLLQPHFQKYQKKRGIEVSKHGSSSQKAESLASASLEHAEENTAI